MTTYSTLDGVARRQHGLVASSQLTHLGFTPPRIRALVRAGKLVRVRRGVFRLCGVTPTWATMAMAAVLAAGDGAVLSHRSAAVLWGLLDHHDEAGPLEITAPRIVRLTGVTAHRHRLGPGEITRRDAIPVTAAERTLVDLAESVRNPDELGRLCDGMLRRRLVTVGRLHAVALEHAGPGRRQLLPMRVALAERVPGFDPGANAWEQRMDRMWDELGLPRSERQYRIRIGRRSYRVDRAIVDLKIAVEWDGLDPHAYRAQLHDDVRRRAELTAAGWRVLDFTPRSKPDLIARAVLAVVAERREVRERVAARAP